VTTNSDPYTAVAAIPVLRRLADAAIMNADILLWRRGRGPVGRVIAQLGRGIYSHAGLAAWRDGSLVSIDATQFHGVRQVQLAEHVDRWPGRIDVYRSNPCCRWPFDRQAAVARMAGFLGSRYGWPSFWRAALWHVPFVRLWVAPEVDDESNGSLAPVCSQAVAIAIRAGGVDPVPRLPDRLTEPNDLARSMFFDYVCTLF
jgi:hypothetical protein